jgi:phytoene synthase
LQTLAAIACALPQPVTDDERLFARRLGSAVKRTEFLRDLRLHVLAGRLPLPLDDLDSARVDLAQIPSGNVTPQFAEMLSRQRDALAAELDSLPATLASEHRARQRHGLVLAALYAELAGRIVHRGELARTPAELSSWNRVWTAWRTAVRHR